MKHLPSQANRSFRIGAAALAMASLCATQLDAKWPPPEGASAADLADPANWPNDPKYGYDDEHDGQWNYYSFVPTQSGRLTLRPGETASGMSIDLAWRWTTGNDDVLLAIMDSGIEWEKSDLLDRAWLNPVELQAFKPTKANGDACGDAGKLVGYDCNGDGIFSVSDYAESPNLEPKASAGNPLGDKNLNGVLDAGDLILNFSDGIDDDNNGHVDDISGWDFMKDDNNPYDDSRYGHGTSEAGYAVATGNNGIGGIGGCPNCRFVMLRTGDSFMADVNAVAAAIVYATDNGANIIQSAVGTVNMNAFAQQALDYAYAKGVITIMSMADENARHANVPGTANHTLPVHAIEFAPGTSVTNVETFLDFNPCTNFGGQNLLSVSGTACSSEAVGQLAGMTGLLISAASKYGISPALSPGEIMQLWISTADDIDVPESRELGEDSAKYFWSQPGFDQRFGYGRTNANTAVEWVKDGKIPPAVDIVSPSWFEVLYRDKLTGPVEIRGQISTRVGATSYDYVVEWAPGVEPLDAAFSEIAGETNVPANVITGADGPLAQLDVRTIDTSHEPDADSPLGENEHTITVRVRAVAHYGGTRGDVPGEMRRTYYVHSDPDLVTGFPIFVGASGEGSPKMADIDEDGLRDLIYPTSDGTIHVLSLTADGPRPTPGFPFHSKRIDGLEPDPGIAGKSNYLSGDPTASGYRDTAPSIMGQHVDVREARDSFNSTPAIADIDGDGHLEIVATTYRGTIYVINHDGTIADGFPLRLPEVPSCPRDASQPSGPCADVNNLLDRGALASPVLADMNRDGKLDIIQAAFDGKIHVIDSKGTPIAGWPVTVHYNGTLQSEAPAHARVITTPAVADFNGDGYPEVLVGSNERLGEGSNSAAVYLIDGRGTAISSAPWLTNWPVTMTSLNLLPLVGEGIVSAGAIGEFEGTLAAVAHGNAGSPMIMPMDPGPQSILSEIPPNLLPLSVDEATGKPRRGVAPTARFGELSIAERDVMFPLFAAPSLGDIDQDGVLDVVTSGSSLTLAESLLGSGAAAKGQHLIAVWSGRTGKMMPSSPYLLEDYSFLNSHAIVDLNGDNYPEVIAGSAGYFIHAYDGCGREPEGWPKFTGQWNLTTPAVGDLDGDGKLELATGTRSGWLYLWRTEGRSDGMIQWESYHHDNLNSGNVATPLSQGDASLMAAEPLTVAFCRAALSGGNGDDLEAAGGCGNCRVGAQHSPGHARWLILAAAIAMGASRRRRRIRKSAWQAQA